MTSCRTQPRPTRLDSLTENRGGLGKGFTPQNQGMIYDPNP